MIWGYPHFRKPTIFAHLAVADLARRPITHWRQQSRPITPGRTSWRKKKLLPSHMDRYIYIYIYTCVVGVKYIDTPIMEDIYIYIYPIYHGSWMINYCLADAWECERNGWECGNWSFFCAVSLIMVHRQISSLNEAQLYCWSSIYTVRRFILGDHFEGAFNSTEC